MSSVPYCRRQRGYAYARTMFVQQFRTTGLFLRPTSRPPLLGPPPAGPGLLLRRTFRARAPLRRSRFGSGTTLCGPSCCSHGLLLVQVQIVKDLPDGHFRFHLFQVPIQFSESDEVREGAVTTEILHRRPVDELVVLQIEIPSNRNVMLARCWVIHCTHARLHAHHMHDYMNMFIRNTYYMHVATDLTTPHARAHRRILHRRPVEELGWRKFSTQIDE